MNPAIIFPRPTARVARGGLVGGACVTPEERAMAADACSRTYLRGIGQEDMVFGGQAMADAYHPYSDSRWRDIPPCQVRDLPDCGCASDWDVLALTPCIAGTAGPEGWSREQHDNWCAQRGAGLLTSSYCMGNTLPPMPSCLEEGAREGLGYCSQHGFVGPNAYANSLCWNAIKSGMLPSLLQLRDCAPDAEPPPGGTPFTPPAAPPVDYYEEPPPPVAPRTERASMMLPGLILLLLVGGGTAYYVAQRKPKR